MKGPRVLLAAVLSISAMLALAGPAAATGDGPPTWLHEPHKVTNSGCPCGYLSVWHFVNNQTDGTEYRGRLWAEFAPFEPGWDRMVRAYKINKNVQHFRLITRSRVLLNAKTNLPGKLVLSDVSCKPVCGCGPG